MDRLTKIISAPVPVEKGNTNGNLTTTMDYIKCYDENCPACYDENQKMMTGSITAITSHPCFERNRSAKELCICADCPIHKTKCDKPCCTDENRTS